MGLGLLIDATAALEVGGIASRALDRMDREDESGPSSLIL
jgi:hypothetical protein